MIRYLASFAAAALLVGLAWPASAQPVPAQPTTAGSAPQDIRLGLIKRKPPPPPTYTFDPIPEDEGFAGAQVALRENNTTGAFTGRRFTLDEAALEEGESPVSAARKMVEGGAAFLAVSLPADETLAVADAVKDRALVFNVGSADDGLRGADCRANLFHVAPSRAMLADGLAQFLAFKRWRKVFLIVGPQPADKLYAEAVRRAAKKFGLTITAEKAWEFGPLARAKGDAPTQAEAFVFTRGVDYDVAVLADEAGDFGDYVFLRTADPRPTAGTQGLVPTSWHPTHEAWGAAQLQNRFRRSAERFRFMRPADYQAWVAVRAVGEAATRTGGDSQAVARYLLGENFALPAFKGVPVTFRPWDRQLRQPILLAQPRSLVSVAPEQGFLHQRTPLDTLGIDQPESACRAS
jgi:ABC transporter substrate binding protein (PQQ-dependent alcohol dehydrogenase system)